MRITIATILLIVVVIMVSIFVANVSNMLNVNFEASDEIAETYWKEKVINDKVVISDKEKHLFWFVQISDIHISIFHDAGRTRDFQDFCDNTIPAIKPPIILATGDLTDAKQEDNVGSRQYDEEWRRYRQILDSCQSLRESKWLDIRGNHDNFDVPGVGSERNLYRLYSERGKESRSYGYIHEAEDGTKYGFVALDACPEQGLRRPFNFIGLLNDGEISHVKSLPATRTNYTIWFGHYPTSCILSRDSQVRKMIGEGSSSIAYLCGHLHTLGGLVPHMYTLQKQGYLELELGDWKDNRMYRIAAIDHGIFSFVDIKHKDWPVILITNPKHVLFTTPRKEPLHRMGHSTHVRILVFSTDEILSVAAKINNGEWNQCRHIKGPLYVMAWKPKLYESGINYIHVMATDRSGKEKVVTQPFSLDGTRASFDLLPRLFLMANTTILFQVFYGLAMIGCVLPLCVLRYLNSQIKRQGINPFKTKIKFIDNWLRRLWIIANINRFYYPIILYPIYLTIGPWTVGELIHGHIGVLFAWGTFINGTFLPGGITYAYGFFQLFLFQGPFILALGYRLDYRLKETDRRQKSAGKLLALVVSHSLLFLLLASQVALAYGFWLSYGTLAAFLSPFRIWPLLMSIWAWRDSQKIHKSKIRTAAKVWLEKEHTEEES